MPPLCNANAAVQCPHGAKVVVVPRQTKVMIGGAPALRTMDVMGSPIIVASCSQFPPNFFQIPCAVIVGPPMGSTKVMIGGLPALLSTDVMITNGAPVPSPATITAPGQVKVMEAPSVSAGGGSGGAEPKMKDYVTDVICGKVMERSEALFTRQFSGKDLYFHAVECVKAFDKQAGIETKEDEYRAEELAARAKQAPG